ncbi:hypothetical protein V8C86DRAFT_1694152 [Haematococcus lacustris]
MVFAPLPLRVLLACAHPAFSAYHLSAFRRVACMPGLHNNTHRTWSTLTRPRCPGLTCSALCCADGAARLQAQGNAATAMAARVSPHRPGWGTQRRPGGRGAEGGRTPAAAPELVGLRCLGLSD